MISHGGIADIRKHIGTAKHKCRLPDFFASNAETGVIRAETLFSEFIVEHNLPIACANHAAPLFRKMFTDSATAKKYGCGRTKTACIVQMLAKADAEELIAVMKNGPYSIATDGSNDAGASKLYPVAVRIFSNQHGQVVSALLAIRECEKSSTGNNIFNILDTELKIAGISWQQCMSFSIFCNGWSSPWRSSIHKPTQSSCIYNGLSLSFDAFVS